jgi:hypothetical protein
LLIDQRAQIGRVMDLTAQKAFKDAVDDEQVYRR